jgi:hypothetical protein
MSNHLPEIVFCTPGEWGVQIYVDSLQRAKPIVEDLRQLGGGFETASVDDLETYSLRPDGRYEGEGEWSNGFTRQAVPIVTLTPQPDGTLLETDCETEIRQHSPGGMVPIS